MKRIRNLVIGGIENKVFNLILAAVLLTTLVFMSGFIYQNRMLEQLSAESSEKQQEAITGFIGEVMDEVVANVMDHDTEMQATIADDMFHDLATHVQMMGDYAQILFDEGESVGPNVFAAPDPALDGEITTQLILAPGADEEALADRIAIAGSMASMMTSMFEASDETNSCFIALPEGAFLVVDDRSAAKYSESGNMVIFDPRTRPWYKMAVEAGEMIFTDVEIDAFTGDIGVVCAEPIYDQNGELVAVVGSDLFLSSMQETVQASDKNGGFVFVVNQNGHVVFSPRSDGTLQVQWSSVAPDLRLSENKELAALISDAMEGKTDIRTVTLEDGTYYMLGAPLKTVGWTLISAFSQEMADQPAQTMSENYQRIQDETAAVFLAKKEISRKTIMILLLVATALTLLSAIVLGKKIVTPLNTITRRIASLSETNLEFKMEDAFRTGDEIEVLAQSFANLSHRTVMYVDQVKTVTAEKERISTELHMANQIQESMLPSIFPAFPERQEFDIYAAMVPAREVGGDFYDFFLIDEDHLCMVMADVSGKGVPAALFMMISKIIIQSCAMLGRSAGETLTKTNEALCSNNRMEMFVTVWLGILEISTGRLVAANAGHEYPAIMRADSGAAGDDGAAVDGAAAGTDGAAAGGAAAGSAAGAGRFELLKDKHGLVIGAFDGVRYKEYELNLAPGDKLFLYTDGGAEAMNGDKELFGTDRMLDALNEAPYEEPQEIISNVWQAINEFVGDNEQFDDLTMLCMEYKGTET